MPFQKGQPRPANAGRKKNTPNADNGRVRAILERLGHDPHEGMAKIAQNDVTCTVCRGALKTRFKLAKERPCKCLPGEDPETPDPDCIWCAGTGSQVIGERTCMSCYATGMEPIEPRLMGQMNAELAKYVEPQLKAIEHSGNADKPIEHNMTVEFV